VPSRASRTASSTTSAGAGDVEPERSEAQGAGEQRLDDGDAAERERVPAEQVALAERHGEQALERAGAALAQHGDAGHQEHRDEGEQGEQRTADAVEDLRRVVEHEAQERQQDERRDEHERDAAVVVAELGEDPARGGEGQRALMRAPPSRRG
jgi:hypothetical protein